MKKKNVVIEDNHNYDNEGNILPAFPVSESTKKDKAKTSVGFTALSVILLLLAFLPIIAGTAVLGVYCYQLVPYYTFWPFVGMILCGILGLAFYIGCLIVTRKKSKHSIRSQTAKMVVTFVCLTSVFAALVTYVFPDVIAFATQNTLFTEDLLYNAEGQADTNAKLERDFIRYNILAGNFGHDLSYHDMSQLGSTGEVGDYEVAEIQTQYDKYMSMESSNSGDIARTVELMKKGNNLKYEMYEFIYNNFILTDYSYAFMSGTENIAKRRAATLAMVDYIYSHGKYEQQIKDGFSDPEIQELFNKNYDSFNQDGYLTFDDSPLLYAQVQGRMTIPIVLRLILNEPWKYSQPGLNMDDYGTKYNYITGADEVYYYPEYYEDSTFLLSIYDPDCWEAYENILALYPSMGYDHESTDRKLYEGCARVEDGTAKVGDPMNFAYYMNPDDISDKYNGWIIYEDGQVKRPQSWLVLDMLGDPMPLASLDLSSGIAASILPLISSYLPEVIDGVGELLTDDLTPLLNYVTAGASLSIALYLDDDGMMQITLFSANVPNAMLGYMQASWVQQDSLLFAVVTVIGSRNWLSIFGAIGAVLVIAAGVLRECGQKTRERTEKSRDRILRENAANAAGIDAADIPPVEGIAPIE